MRAPLFADSLYSAQTPYARMTDNGAPDLAKLNASSMYDLTGLVAVVTGQSASTLLTTLSSRARDLHTTHATSTVQSKELTAQPPQAEPPALGL